MAWRSELPTVPPPFDIERYAKDSDAQLVAVAACALEERPAVESAMRLATRKPPATGSATWHVATGEPSASRPGDGASLFDAYAGIDEIWARAMTGSLVAAIGLDALKGTPLDHRAAYLLSWMDGTVDLETLVEVSTMPRGEVIRIVRELYESGIVEVR
jgi:hypothetical protein